MTLRELRRLVRKWQERLRLQDWNLTVRFQTRAESQEQYGLCEPVVNMREATISIAQPEHCAGEEDVEVVVVHELLHLHYAPFRTRENSPLEIAEENAVHVLSRLLVALDRKDESIIGLCNGKPLSRVARIQ